MFSKSIIVASLLAAVNAHQNFHQFWVNGVSPGYQTSIRMPPSNSPVTDVTSNDITCNVNGNVVPSGVNTTAAKEGDAITVQWDSSTHPGPIQHYLFGPVDDASQATGIGEWFKIDEYVEVNGTWASNLMDAGNMSYTFNLPTGMATGEYLLRSEMLALHGAQTLGGAQCTYTAPGGAIATCGSGSSGSGTIATASASATASAVSSSATAVSPVETSAATSSAIVASSSAIVSSSAIASSVVAPVTTSVPTTFVTATSSATVPTSSADDADDECEA
ncbi:hypothetical protein DID88_002349 [Monilinia fructigena]|uniref:AA9 family lytic polysaccharide monooxygenase n=1 Tax=Monilinia fructigena TaxID=38457 RepID=A0A395ICQ3_9HELO|nr:hypothetical protein DID88_002349 [Monilinia fructigena]